MLGGLAFLVVALACGVNVRQSEEREGTIPHAYKTTGDELGLRYAKSGRVNCTLDGEIDGYTIHVGKEKRNRDQGMGFQTDVTIDLGLPASFSLDSGSDGAGDLLRGERIKLADPAFDDKIQVWGDKDAARATLDDHARAEILRVSADTRILILKGRLIGEASGHVDDAAKLQQMILGTVDVAKALKPAGE